MPVTTDRLETGHHPETPVGDTVQRRFLRSQVAVLHAYAAAAGGHSFDDGELAGGTTGVPVPYLNQAVLLRPVFDATDPILRRAADALAGVPGSLLSVWPTPDLAAAGWHLVGHPALVARPGVPLTRAGAPRVEVVEVTTDEQLACAERIVIEGYPLPGAPAFPPGALGSGVCLRLGLLDGEPVGVAASHVSNGVVNLCLAATLAAARRHGVWQSLVTARLDDAPDLPAVAFTSDFSRPGFEAMGFLVLARCTLWFRGA